MIRQNPVIEPEPGTRELVNTVTPSREELSDRIFVARTKRGPLSFFPFPFLFLLLCLCDLVHLGDRSSKVFFAGKGTRNEIDRIPLNFQRH